MRGAVVFYSVSGADVITSLAGARERKFGLEPAGSSVPSPLPLPRHQARLPSPPPTQSPTKATSQKHTSLLAPRHSLQPSPQTLWTEGDNRALLAAKAFVGDSREDWEVVADAVGPVVHCVAQYARLDEQVGLPQGK